MYLWSNTDSKKLNDTLYGHRSVGGKGWGKQENTIKFKMYMTLTRQFSHNISNEKKFWREHEYLELY